MLHPSILAIIHRSGLKGGMGLIADPGYWSGTPADTAYLSGVNLFRLWQEALPSSPADTLPAKASEHLRNMISDIKLLRPDQFFGNLHRWALEGYGAIEINEDIYGNAEQIVLGILSRGRSTVEREREQSNAAKYDFCKLLDRSNLNR